MGEFLTGSPIHTAAASCGVYPQYHTSQPFSVVPVLPARGYGKYEPDGTRTG